MTIIRLETAIRAPIERCFDLSRSIDLHQDSAGKTEEEAVAGVTSGMIGLGETVTWRARHLGVRQTLTSKITGYQRPTYFRDEMLEGAFAFLGHDHHFESTAEGTLMRDTFEFRSPLGPLGAIVDRVFMTGYLERFIRERNDLIKRIAEGDDWARYVPG